jgi:hypothetical protein
MKITKKKLLIILGVVLSPFIIFGIILEILFFVGFFGIK